jgi:four helix bundle protein
MQGFDHERLEVYRAALDFIAIADDTAEALPPGRGYLADQLRRASGSIVLNIAEGAGEFSKRDKARFYRMALRSATECAGTLDICKRLRLGDETNLTSGRDCLLRIVAMLVRLVRNMSSGTGSGGGTGSGKDGEGR